MLKIPHWLPIQIGDFLTLNNLRQQKQKNAPNVSGRVLIIDFQAIKHQQRQRQVMLKTQITLAYRG